jgi:hypothetical protein
MQPTATTTRALAAPARFQSCLRASVPDESTVIFPVRLTCGHVSKMSRSLRGVGGNPYIADRLPEGAGPFKISQGKTRPSASFRHNVGYHAVRHN